nr:hypothetical protein [Tanacetum cinerariifolium]
MSQLGKDEELKSHTLEKKEATQSEPKPDDESKSSSTTRSNTNEEDEKKCMDVVDYLARQAKGIAIEKQGTVNCKGKTHVVAGKRRKKASGESCSEVVCKSDLYCASASVSGTIDFFCM